MAERRLPGPVALLGAETSSQVRLLFRHPLSVLFAVALPLLLLPMLDALNGDTSVRLPRAVVGVEGGGVDAAGRAGWMQYATPAIAAFAVVAACFANLAIRTAVAREQGVLKRVRGTPMPAVSHLGGRVLSNVLVALVVTAASLALGVLAYDVSVAAADLPVVLLVVVLGACTFSALGLAVTAVVPDADSAPAIVYGLLFPLAFLSNVFYPPELAPAWMSDTAEVLPMGPLVTALVGALTPTAEGSGVTLDDVASLAAWGVGGAVVAGATFRWAAAGERQVVGARVPGSRRRLALAVSAAVVATGVFAVDAEPAPARMVAGTAAELEERGVLQAEVPLVSDGPGGVVSGADGLPVVASVTVLGGEGQPSAFVFGQSCAVRPVDDVDPAWLGRVAPGRRGGAFVSTCTGAVFERSGHCVGGPCPAAVLEVPVEVEGPRVIVRSTVVGRTRSAAGDPVAPVTLDYSGRATGDGARSLEVAGDFELRADDGGISLTGPEGFDIGLAGGGLGGAVDLLEASVGEDSWTVPLAGPLPLLAAATGSSPQAVARGATSTVEHPGDSRWVLTHASGRPGDPTSPARLGISGQGALLDWSRLTIRLGLGPADGPTQQVIVELTRR